MMAIVCSVAVPWPTRVMKLLDSLQLVTRLGRLLAVDCILTAPLLPSSFSQMLLDTLGPGDQLSAGRTSNHQLYQLGLK